MPKQIFAALSNLLIFTLLLTACKPSPPPLECTDAIGCVDIAPGEPIEIGVIQDLSGSASKSGSEQVQAIQLALLHKGDEILGHPVELQIKDEGCTAEGGANAAASIIMKRQLVAVIGTSCSAAAVPASRFVSEAGLVMVSGMNGASSLTSTDDTPGADWQPGYFRGIYNYADIVRAAAVFSFHEMGAKKVAVIDDGGGFSRGTVEEFSRVFTDFGGEIVLSAVVDQGEQNVIPVLEAIIHSGADLTYFPLYPSDAALFIRNARQIPELDEMNFLGSGSIYTNDFIEAAGEDGRGVYFTAPQTPSGPAYERFISGFSSQYKQAPENIAFGTVYAYDATHLLLDAIVAVAVQDDDGTLHIGRQALRDQLYATTDFDGVTGKLSCDQFGDCSASKFLIARLDDPSAGLKEALSNVVYTYMPEQQDEEND